MSLLAIVFVVSACGDSESSSADPARFCEILDELDEQDTSDMSPEEALPVMEDGRAKYEEGLEVAPDEIKEDAETFANYVIEVTDVLIAAGGDESQVDEAAVEAVSNDGVDEAVRSVTAWRGGELLLPPRSTPKPAPTPNAEPTTPSPPNSICQTRTSDPTSPDRPTDREANTASTIFVSVESGSVCGRSSASGNECRSIRDARCRS